MFKNEKEKVDKVFLAVLVILVGLGLFVFLSASFGLLARNDGAKMSSVIFNQLMLGIVSGSVVCYIFSRINYKLWRRLALFALLTAVVANLLLFVPGLGFKYGGAVRWFIIGPFSIQPSEFLKIAFIIYMAVWLSGAKDRIREIRFGIIPFMILLGVVGALLLAQPDTDTFVAIVCASLAMYFAAGGRWRDGLVMVLAAVIGLAFLVYARPYVKDRVMTFLDPSRDPQGAGYQIQQSLIAIGSGQTFGRGFGQSIQKFGYLPEPIGDSIFAVAAEEFGFVGAVMLILLFVFLAFRGLKIATMAPDSFGGLLAVGIVILISSQSFMNMASMLGIIPLSGLPLLFVSHGGTAMFFALAEAGIVLNISRRAR